MRVAEAGSRRVACDQWFALLRNVFFMSSRRRHTSFDCDWSSDVGSSDLTQTPGSQTARHSFIAAADELFDQPELHIRSEERRVGKSVDLGGGRISTKK